MMGNSHPSSNPNDDQAFQEMMAKIIEEAFRLPYEYAEAIRLRHREGLDFEEIAKRLNIHIASVEPLLCRAYLLEVDLQWRKEQWGK